MLVLNCSPSAGARQAPSTSGEEFSLSGVFCAACRERTGPEAAETPLVQAPVFKQSMRWCLVW